MMKEFRHASVGPGNTSLMTQQNSELHNTCVFVVLATFTIFVQWNLYYGHVWDSLKSPDQRRCPHFNSGFVHFLDYA